MALAKVALSEKEKARLTDLVVHLKNILASKDQEKEKLELSFEAFVEKKRKREEELIRQCEALEEEKGSLREKIQELQASMETLRHESNVLQQDYKKACELADLKSQDNRDIVDKLDDSQKHLQETRVKLSRAETELKQTAEELLQGRRENQNLLQELTRTKEEIEENRKSLRDEMKSGQESISELSSQLRDKEAAIRTLGTEKNEVEQMFNRVQEEMWESKEELHSCTSEMRDKEISLKRQKEDNTIKRLQEQVQELETCRSELVSELENAQEEMCRLRDKAHFVETENSSVKAAMESELEAQNSKINELEALNTETLEKLQKAIDCAEVKDKEAKEKIKELLSEKGLLSSAVDENVTRLDQLRDENTQLEDANREEKRARMCLEETLAGQETQMLDLLDKNRRLEDDLSGTEVQLGVVRKETEESKEQIEKLQRQSQREVERLENQLSARCSQVEKLQRSLNEQSDKLESLNDHVNCLTEQLESVKKEHEGCAQKEQSSNSLREQVLELEHQLAREQSNTDVMMQAFREQEEQWEKEKVKILSSFKNSGSKSGTQNSSAISEENEQLKRKLGEMQNNLETKEKEHSETLRLIEKRASSTSILEAELHSRIKKLESECDELKYNLKQKDEDIFVKEESLKQKEQAVKSLESKYAAAEEVERELRHHLGEVTQQLEWSKESNTTAVTQNNNNNTVYEDISKELAALKAEREDRDKDMEEERVRIVEAAKGFAIKQEETFGKTIAKLEKKLSSKDEELHDMDSELKQLRHNLQTLQQEKNVLLEAADEREQEFDAERQRWSSGDYTYEKVQQCIEDLEEERKRATVLQENCAELQEKLHQRENCNLLLQKKLDELQNEQNLDSKERETREDDLQNTIDSLRSKSEKLQEEVQNEKSVIAGLTNEKAELLAKLETLEEQLNKSIRFASDLQQECDVLKEKLEGLKKDNDRLLKEKDATLLSKNKDKLDLENANRKLQELRQGLEKEVKEKIEGEKILDGIMNKSKDLEEKLKQAEEKMVEMSEDHQVELDSVRFTLFSAKDECIALQEENEDLKRNLTGRTEQHRWSNEKNCLLQELEEVKMRYEKASKDREDLESELHKLNIKVMSLEENSTSSKDAAAEIESLKTKVNELSEELEKEKKRGDEKEKEANDLLESSFQLVKKHKKIVREKESLESRFQIVCEKLNSTKAAKSREDAIQQDGHSSNSSKQTSTASEVSLPKPTSGRETETSHTISNPAVLLSPLARSLSNLEIKTVETATSVIAGRTQLETTETSEMRCQSSSVITPPEETESSKMVPRKRVINSSILPRPRKRQSVARGNVLPKLGQLTENVDSKKRLNQEDVRTNPTKRCRVTIGGDSVEMPTAQQLPDGLPEVVGKGFADIPPPPIKSPFILRRSTAPSFASGVRTRNQLKQGASRSALPTAANTKVTSFPKENPMLARSPPRGENVHPEKALSRRKTNQSNIAIGPRTKIPKPETQVARPNKPSDTSGSSRGLPAGQGRAVARLMTGPGPANTASNDKECKMQ